MYRTESLKYQMILPFSTIRRGKIAANFVSISLGTFAFFLQMLEMLSPNCLKHLSLANNTISSDLVRHVQAFPT